MTDLFVLGDSISIGYGPHLAQFLPEGLRYARKTRIPGNNTFAVEDNGGDSNRVLQYLRHRLDADESFLPDVLLLNCGLHDIRRDPKSDALQVAIDQYEQNLREIKRLVVSNGIRLAWVTTTPVNDERHRQHEQAFIRRNQDVLDYNAVAEIVFADDTIIDLYTFTRRLGTNGMTLYGDHVHFVDAICQLQAAYVCGALNNQFT